MSPSGGWQGRPRVKACSKQDEQQDHWRDPEGLVRKDEWVLAIFGFAMRRARGLARLSVAHDALFLSF
jgi:hypothetical protein